MPIYPIQVRMAELPWTHLFILFAEKLKKNRGGSIVAHAIGFKFWVLCSITTTAGLAPMPFRCKDYSGPNASIDHLLAAVTAFLW